MSIRIIASTDSEDQLVNRFHKLYQMAAYAAAMGFGADKYADTCDSIDKLASMFGFSDTEILLMRHAGTDFLTAT